MLVLLGDGQARITKGTTLYMFDRIMAKPVAYVFDRLNDDGWVRVKIAEGETHSISGEWTANPPVLYYLDHDACIDYQIQQLFLRKNVVRDYVMREVDRVGSGMPVH